MKGIIKDFILNSIAAGVLCHRRLRMKIYRLYGAEIPADCEIKPSITPIDNTTINLIS